MAKTPTEQYTPATLRARANDVWDSNVRRSWLEHELDNHADAWKEQLRAMTASERLVKDDRDRLEGELELERRLSERTCNAMLEFEAERDEARAVARGLLRLARAQLAERVPLINRAYDLEFGHGKTEYRRAQLATTERGVVEALAALPPAVRRLLQEE